MGHQNIFDQIVLRKYLPEIKAYKERWNHQHNETSAPITNAYSLTEKDYTHFTHALRFYKEKSRPMIYEIIICLLKEYGVIYKELPITGENVNAFSLKGKTDHLWLSRGIENPFMKCVIIDIKGKKILFVFRDFGIYNRISKDGLKNVRQLVHFDEHFYVSFVYERAYEEVVNHNDNTQDLTRGTLCLSLKDFFHAFFDPTEYDLFCTYIERYKKEVIEYLGVTVTKTLQPNAIPGFKKDMIETIIKKDYFSTLCALCPNHMPTKALVEKIQEQFVQEKYYKALVGSSKFAMSLLTSEWLYSTLYNIVTVDQTSIILGYFKSIEQLLFDYISFQAAQAKANRLKTIKLDKNGKPEILNETLIQSKSKYMTLGTFTGFFSYNGNYDLIRSDLLSDPALDASGFISDFIKTLAEMRNEYLHRENIDNWQIVDKARDTAFSLYFIILGAYTYDKNEKQSIGIQDNSMSVSTDVLLCEYIHKRASEDHDVYEIPIFFVNHDYNSPLWSDPDIDIMYDKYGNATYSGVYFHKMGMHNSDEYIELSYTIDKLKNLTIEEDRFIITKENPIYSHLKGARKVVYENGVFTPYE